MFFSAHTLYALTIYTPFKSLRSKEENDRCQMFIRRLCSILQVLTDRVTHENAEFCSRDQTHFVQDVYLRTHTHTHIQNTSLYIPFDSLWSNKENVGCQISIRGLCSILQVFEFRVLVEKTKMMSITSRDRIHFVQDVFLRTHTNSTYNTHSIWKIMIQGRKLGLLEVDPKLIADSTRGFKVLRVSCENFSFWFAQISK